MKWGLSRLGIRVQLAVSYTLISALLIFSSAVALEITLQSILASSFDTTLQMRAQQVAEGVSVSHGTLSVSAIVSELPELDATAALIDSDDLTGENTNTTQETKESTGSYTNQNMLVRVLDTRGKLLYNIPATRDLVIPSASLTQPLQGKTLVWNPDEHEGTANSTVQHDAREPHDDLWHCPGRSITHLNQREHEHHDVPPFARDAFSTARECLLQLLACRACLSTHPPTDRDCACHQCERYAATRPSSTSER